MPISALPPRDQVNGSVADGKGTDFDNWIQRFIPQGWFAFGPNATERWDWITLFCIPVWFRLHEVDVRFFGDTFTINRPEPVKWIRIVFPIPVLARWRRVSRLIIGKGVTRWETDGAGSQIFVAPYAEGWQSSFFGRRKHLPATEMNPSNPEYRHPILLDDLTPQRSLKTYSPSVIQYWSNFSVALIWPLHFFLLIQYGGRDPQTGRLRKRFFFRIGCRHAVGSSLYDVPSAFIGFNFS